MRQNYKPEPTLDIPGCTTYNEYKFSENKFIKNRRRAVEKFIGRSNELALLREALSKPSASVMVYGKRKVGKTTLLAQALKESADTAVYYECLKSTLEDNVSGFVTELVRQGVLPVKLNFASFADVFAYVDSLGKTLNIVIDEYPYLKEMAEPATVDSQFQKIIDNYIRHIRLFISGSHVGMMKDMLAEKNALYGRFSLTLRLTELNYKEAAEFYPEKSVYDKVALYSVFGGSPFVNGFLRPDADLKSNIVQTILNPNSPVFNYAERLLISDCAKMINAERIMYAIANGRKKYGKIEALLNMKSNGLLSKQLASLLEMEILSKYYPINRPEDKKKVSYELSDNLLRFYYAFVYKNKSALTMLGAEAFYDEYIGTPIITFISHRFEEMCRSYFSLSVKSGRLRGIGDIGAYYYDDAESHANGEFDVVMRRKDIYDIYEVKYHTSPLSLVEMDREAQQVRRIKGLPLGDIGFISVSGFEKNDAPYKQISGEELYACS